MTALEATVQADRAAVGQREGRARRGARATIENARAVVRADEAVVDSARLQLGYTTIRSPLDGTHGPRRGARGQPGRAGRVDAARDRLHAGPDVRELQRERARGAVRVAAAPGQVGGRARAASRSRCPTTAPYPAPGPARLRGPRGGSAHRHARAARGLPEPGARCSSRGSTCACASFWRSGPTRCVVPQAAVQESQGSASVFVVGADQTVQARTVRMGPRFGRCGSWTTA